MSLYSSLYVGLISHRKSNPANNNARGGKSEEQTARKFGESRHTNKKQNYIYDRTTIALIVCHRETTKFAPLFPQDERHHGAYDKQALIDTSYLLLYRKFVSLTAVRYRQYEIYADSPAIARQLSQQQKQQQIDRSTMIEPRRSSTHQVLLDGW